MSHIDQLFKLKLERCWNPATHPNSGSHPGQPVAAQFFKDDLLVMCLCLIQNQVSLQQLSLPYTTNQESHLICESHASSQVRRPVSSILQAQLYYTNRALCYIDTAASSYMGSHCKAALSDGAQLAAVGTADPAALCPRTSPPCDSSMQRYVLMSFT